jgi:hypothetical protein
MSDKIMDASFREATDIYTYNYLQYKMTGNPAYKTAYENAKSWMDTYVAQKEKDIQQDSEYIKGFVKEYAQTNPEMVTLQSHMKRINKEGPAIQDRYITEQALKSTPPPLDMTPYYVKAGVVAALTGVLVVLSFF